MQRHGYDLNEASRVDARSWQRREWFCRVLEFVGIGFLSCGKAHLSLQIVVGRNCRELGAYGRRRPSCHGVFVEMTDDVVDDFRVGEHRDDLHFGATFAEERVHLEDFSDEPCPGSSAGGQGFVEIRFWRRWNGNTGLRPVVWW